jgi:hypothetical protein
MQITLANGAWVLCRNTYIAVLTGQDLTLTIGWQLAVPAEGAIFTRVYNYRQISKLCRHPLRLIDLYLLAGQCVICSRWSRDRRSFDVCMCSTFMGSVCLLQFISRSTRLVSFLVFIVHFCRECMNIVRCINPPRYIRQSYSLYNVCWSIC